MRGNSLWEIMTWRYLCKVGGCCRISNYASIALGGLKWNLNLRIHPAIEEETQDVAGHSRLLEGAGVEVKRASKKRSDGEEVV
jgi:hypothetical protein